MSVTDHQAAEFARITARHPDAVVAGRYGTGELVVRAAGRDVLIPAVPQGPRRVGRFTRVWEPPKPGPLQVAEEEERAVLEARALQVLEEVAGL